MPTRQRAPAPPVTVRRHCCRRSSAPAPLTQEQLDRELAALAAGRAQHPWTPAELNILSRARAAGVTMPMLARNWTRLSGTTRTLKAIIYAVRDRLPKPT